MSTQYSVRVSLTNSNVHRPSARFRRRQLNRATQPSRCRQMGSDVSPNAAAFEQFLNWLGPDPESAAQTYESIRGRLIRMFSARRCIFPEDLADETFERVAQKLNEITSYFTGDPARYFYGVAKKIYLEYQREVIAQRWRFQYAPATNTDDQDLEHQLKQLDEALSAIPKSDRDMILRYYAGSGKSKIRHRRALAEQCGLGPNALRIRVFRIRKELKNYMLRSDTALPQEYVA